MRIRNLLPVLIGATIVIAIVLYVAFYFIFLDLFVDLWWFRSLQYEAYFWLRLLYRFILSGGVTLFFFAVFYFHFWIASRYLGLNPPDAVLLDADKRRRFQRFADVFMSGSSKIYTPLSFLLAIFIAIPFYEQWEKGLLFFFGSSSGITEPVYGQDVSFYLLSYPIYMLIQQELLSTSIILFLLVGCLYWLEHIFVPNQSKEYPLGAKIHLSILLGFIVLFVVWGFLLERYSLLYVDSHEPVFFGPGFVEIRYLLPLIWLSIFTFLATAIAGMVFIFSEKHRIKLPLIISSLLFFAMLGLQKVELIPRLMTTFIVKPNPVKTEGIFMQYNIEATLDAYDLNNIKTIDFQVKLDATKDIEKWSTQKHFENIPVWDREFLNDVYMQLQGIRPYYRFPAVDEDRYFLNEHLQQVNLAAREMNIKKLPSEAQNWENTHLRYTHGYGAVVTPAAQDADKPIVWYLRDLNMTSDVGFKVKYPDIYYGQEHYQYAIVPNKLTVAGLSTSEADKRYAGRGGVPIPGYFRKILFAFYFRDEKIFFSTNISTRSKLMIRRNIIERINALTPYLHLDKDPYLVIGKDRLYWIQDAYTTSDKYPVSKLAEDDFLDGVQNFNYIRNSVKIVVDAYDGSVDYYIVEPDDPLIKAYSRAYPGVFKNLDEMPDELRKHLRYPRDLFYMQMKVYAKYHQITADLFYEQAETWQFATVDNKTVRPYFITMDFGNCNDKEEFVMINPMTPIHRDNLSMVGIASTLDHDKCGNSYDPSVTIYKFRKDVQVNGPAQVDALIDQDPDISEQFTLWDQHGSSVRRGRMIILPMDNSMLYVQPIYLLSTKTTIPELTRVIVSIGNQVVMDKTLWSAFQRLKKLFIKEVKESTGSGTTLGN
ncbi:UPF0182 family protein [Methylomarinum vadi]|uniref:UPF0182 family protein n=1 Tax=Methylomarinum vadi TaxID=438855 RepID=UPI0004DF7505|nr:UPF0182 family protein [Methylomarinum vadi]